MSLAVRPRASREGGSRSHRLHVQFVIDSLGPGGTERSLTEMLPRLRDAGIDPSIVCMVRRREGFLDEVVEGGFEVRSLSARGRIARILEFRRILVGRRPRVVHTMLFEADLAARVAAAGLGIPVVTSLVGMPYHAARLRDPNVKRWRLRAAQALDGWTARHLTTHFHAVSGATAEHGVRSLGIRAADVSVIHRGRDGGRLGRPGADRRALARERFALGTDERVVACVGRQEFQKGHVHLLEAIASLSPGARPTVLLAGRGGNASQLLRRRRDELGVGDRVRLLGHRDDIAEILASADLFALPSLFEGLPGAVIEALGLGLPIVASDIPAIRETVEPGSNGVLVPPGDARTLGTAIDELLDDPQRMSSFGARSRAIFEERFTLEGSARVMIDLYRRLDARRRREEAQA